MNDVEYGALLALRCDAANALTAGRDAAARYIEHVLELRGMGALTEAEATGYLSRLSRDLAGHRHETVMDMSAALRRVRHAVPPGQEVLS